LLFRSTRITHFKPDSHFNHESNHESWRTIMSNTESTESAQSRSGPSLDLYAVALALLAALLVRFNLIPPIKW
jgi:hypothetical protein